MAEAQDLTRPRPAVVRRPAARPRPPAVERRLAALAALLCAAAALDPDALSQRYRNWSYYPDWVIEPLCMNPGCNQTSQCNTAQKRPGSPFAGCFSDCFSLVQLPREAAAGVFRAFYLQWDGVGYETYSARTTDMVHFDTSDPTLAPGQPGVVFSPRAGRPPLGDAKPAEGDFDFGGAAFIGPLVADYNVTATRVLQRAANESLWYAYFAQPTRPGLEPPPGADGFAASADGLNWRRAAARPFLDVDPAHGAKAWESGQIYAPFVAPAPGGALAVFYNAVGNNSAGKHTEESGQAYLDGGAAALPGVGADGASLWRRDARNPTLPNNALGTSMASDPKIYFDAQQGVWVMIYFCYGGTKTGGACICAAFSDDQVSWAPASTPLYVNGGHPNGLDKCHAHKAWLTGDGKTDRLYLYYTADSCHQGRGIALLTSTPL